MTHDERIRHLLGEKPRLSDEDFDRDGCPSLLLCVAGVVVGMLVEMCAYH